MGWLQGSEAAGLSHAELETHLQVDSRELFRSLFHDHLDLGAHDETRLAGVVGADQRTRSRAETGHIRVLVSVFGQVSVKRIAYPAPARFPTGVSVIFAGAQNAGHLSHY